MTFRPVSAADLPREPEPVTAWIRLDRLTRRVVGRRMEHGPTPETYEALDKLMVLRARTERRLVGLIMDAMAIVLTGRCEEG
jgi:hypothetical protein